MREDNKLLEVNKKIKKLIRISKENKAIKSHIEAFQQLPVKEEKHRGNVNYFSTK